MKKLLLPLLVFFNLYSNNAQQSVDTLFQIEIQKSNYSPKNSPVVFVDAMHNNLHQINSNFAPFAILGRKDGYDIRSLDDWNDMEKADLIIIANAINEKNVGNWERPIFSAFNQKEIEDLLNFVQEGGSLLIIADHMPFAGAASNLAMAFGFEFCDGFAQLAKNGNSPDAFSLTNSRLAPSIITNGSTGKKVTSVISFTGSSFSIPMNATGILNFVDEDVCLQPNIAWQFSESTPKEYLTDKYQGAIMEYGKGKLAVFGEAAMFTAQIISQNGNTFRVGYNSPHASQNVEFIRNLLYWLTQKKEH